MVLGQSTMQEADHREGQMESFDAGIASFIAIVRQLELQLLCVDEPAQFIDVLDRNAKSGNEAAS